MQRRRGSTFVRFFGESSLLRNEPHYRTKGYFLAKVVYFFSGIVWSPPPQKIWAPPDSRSSPRRANPTCKVCNGAGAPFFFRAHRPVVRAIGVRSPPHRRSSHRRKRERGRQKGKRTVREKTPILWVRRECCKLDAIGKVVYTSTPILSLLLDVETDSDRHRHRLSSCRGVS